MVTTTATYRPAAPAAVPSGVPSAGRWRPAVGVVRTEHPLTYVRFVKASTGRWVIVEVYVVSDDSAPIRPDTTQRLRLPTLEALANEPNFSRHLESRINLPGPDLRRAASHFATTWTKPSHWVAQSYLANFPQAGVKQAPMGREPQPDTEPAFEVPRLQTPPEGLTDDFLRKVASAYAIAVSRGEHPAPAIAAASGVSESAVRKWVFTARKRGVMPPGRRGRVG